MKRTFSILLCISMLAAVLSACGGQTPSSDTGSASDATTAAPIETTLFEAHLPKTDLDGYTLRIASFSDIKNQYIYTDEANGDVVNDAIYNSVNLVMETFNAGIEMIYYSSTYNCCRGP